MSGGATLPLPRWIEIGLLPLLNLAMAFAVSGAILAAIGADPLRAIGLMVEGAFGSFYGLGYTLYYATSFIFTGLAVAIGFHAGHFNIGGEGQAYIGGLGAGLVALLLGPYLPGPFVWMLGIAAAALFGLSWAALPAYLQAKRGSHIVITTIMFNFLAAAVMVYLMVNVLIAKGRMDPRSEPFAEGAGLPQMHEVLAWFGIAAPSTPVNLSLVLALLASVFVWVFIWRARSGYEIRASGFSPSAAIYAGIAPARITILALLISGALAGLAGVNEVLGVQRAIILDFVAGAGFTGIAVALMGRNHPVGILLASLLFGALYQGGAEVNFEMPNVTREMIVTIQGLIILFSGALANMNRPWVARLYSAWSDRTRTRAAHG